VSRGSLIDTNVVSEWVKPRPDAGVVSWLDETDEDRIFLSVVSLAKIRLGIERLAPGRRRSRLDRWLREELPECCERRIADACGRFLARARQAGRGLGAMDALIAATCRVCELLLTTRNIGGFDWLGIELFAP